MAVGMADMKYEELNKAKALKNLKCPLCQKFFTNLMQTKCEPVPHTFCQNCIKEHIANNPYCPTCKQAIHIRDLKPIDRIDDANKPAEIENNNLLRGRFLKRATDPYVPVRTEYSNVIECRAADIMCPWKGTPDQLARHMETCVVEKLRPIISKFIKCIKESQNEKQQLQVAYRKLLEKYNRSQNETKYQRASIVAHSINENTSVNSTIYQETDSAESIDFDKKINEDLLPDLFQQVFNFVSEHSVKHQKLVDSIEKLTDTLTQIQLDFTALRQENMEYKKKIDEPELYSRNHNDRFIRPILTTRHNDTSFPTQNMGNYTINGRFTGHNASGQQSNRDGNENSAASSLENHFNAPNRGRSVTRQSPVTNTPGRSKNHRKPNYSTGRRVNKISHCIFTAGGINVNIMGGRNTNVGCGFKNIPQNEENTVNTRNATVTGTVNNTINTADRDCIIHSSNVTVSGDINSVIGDNPSSTDNRDDANNLGSDIDPDNDDGSITNTCFTTGAINYNIMGGHNENIGITDSNNNDFQDTIDENSSQSDVNNPGMTPSDEHGVEDNGSIDEHTRNHPDFVHPVTHHNRLS